MQFMGYRREDGRVGVRNYVLILPGCACASETCRLVASEVRGTKNVIMNVGCSDVQANTDMNLRVLTGFALNPNVFGVIVIGLGCENGRSSRTGRENPCGDFQTCRLVRNTGDRRNGSNNCGRG